MKRVLTIAFVTIGTSATVVVGLAFWGLHNSHPPMPKLAGQILQGTMQHYGRGRSWIAYAPAKRAASPALVVVLHSSMGNAQQARQAFGYDFDVLADQHGFVVAYPNSVEGHWNEAKVKGPFAAKREHVDDVGFLRAMVDDLGSRYNVDRSRVYVTGVSNGGSMVLRLALETPDFARAYAAVVSSVPAPGNMGASPKHQAVSILLMNGTDDPLNPWGAVTSFCMESGVIGGRCCRHKRASTTFAPSQASRAHRRSRNSPIATPATDARSSARYGPLPTSLA